MSSHEYTPEQVIWRQGKQIDELLAALKKNQGTALRWFANDRISSTATIEQIARDTDAAIVAVEGDRPAPVISDGDPNIVAENAKRCVAHQQPAPADHANWDIAGKAEKAQWLKEQQQRLDDWKAAYKILAGRYDTLLVALRLAVGYVRAQFANPKHTVSVYEPHLRQIEDALK